MAYKTVAEVRSPEGVYGIPHSTKDLE